MDVWELYLSAHDGKQPRNAFDLLNFSRSTKNTLTFKGAKQLYTKQLYENNTDTDDDDTDDDDSDLDILRSSKTKHTHTNSKHKNLKKAKKSRHNSTTPQYKRHHYDPQIYPWNIMINDEETNKSDEHLSHSPKYNTYAPYNVSLMKLPIIYLIIYWISFLVLIFDHEPAEEVAWVDIGLFWTLFKIFWFLFINVMIAYILQAHCDIHSFYYNNNTKDHSSFLHSIQAILSSKPNIYCTDTIGGQNIANHIFHDKYYMDHYCYLNVCDNIDINIFNDDIGCILIPISLKTSKNHSDFYKEWKKKQNKQIFINTLDYDQRLHPIFSKEDGFSCAEKDIVFCKNSKSWHSIPCLHLLSLFGFTLFFHRKYFHSFMNFINHHKYSKHRKVSIQQKIYNIQDAKRMIIINYLDQECQKFNIPLFPQEIVDKLCRFVQDSVVPNQVHYKHDHSLLYITQQHFYYVHTPTNNLHTKFANNVVGLDSFRKPFFYLYFFVIFYAIFYHFNFVYTHLFLFVRVCFMFIYCHACDYVELVLTTSLLVPLNLI